MNRPDWRGRVLGAIALVLTGLGFVGLLRVPGEVLRAHPASSLLWLATLCTLAITGEAVQHRQPWALPAATTMAVAGVGMMLANLAERAWVTHDPFLPMVTGVGRWILVFGTALVLQAIDQRKAAAGVRIPWPAPHP